MDGGDDHFAGISHTRRRQLVDVVQLGELTSIVRSFVVTELAQGLVTKVVSVNEEQDFVEAPVFDEPIALRDSHSGLACTGCHLNERTRKPLFNEAALNIPDSCL